MKTKFKIGQTINFTLKNALKEPYRGKGKIIKLWKKGENIEIDCYPYMIFPDEINN